MKVALNYDSSTGALTDNNGMIIVNWMGLNYEPVGASAPGAAAINTDSEVVKLSNNGMTAEDLIKMRKAGVI